MTSSPHPPAAILRTSFPLASESTSTPFRKELATTLLLPEIAADTIDRSIRERYRRWPLTRRCNPDRFPLSALIAFEKCVVRTFYGDSKALGRRAFDSMLAF